MIATSELGTPDQEIIDPVPSLVATDSALTGQYYTSLSPQSGMRAEKPAASSRAFSSRPSR